MQPRRAFGVLMRSTTTERMPTPRLLTALATVGPGSRGRSRCGRTCCRCREPGLIIVGLGRRDVSYDLGLPGNALAWPAWTAGASNRWRGMALSQLNDQHGYLRAPSVPTPAKVGDRIGFWHFAPVYGHRQMEDRVSGGDDYRIRDEIAHLFPLSVALAK